MLLIFSSNLTTAAVTNHCSGHTVSVAGSTGSQSPVYMQNVVDEVINDSYECVEGSLFCPTIYLDGSESGYLTIDLG